MTGSAAVYAPAPLLTVTIEEQFDDDDIHLHAGGQGFWIARMLAVLGIPTTLVGSFGGEAGAVVRRLIEQSGVGVEGVEVDANNGAYVHDRRRGERREIALHRSDPLARHDADDLYTMMVAAGLDASVCVLGGTDPARPVVVPDTYRRLASDLSATSTVVADLSGEERAAAVAGGVQVVKTSDEDLVADGVLAEDAVEADVGDVATALCRSGALHAVVTRAGEPAVACGPDGAVRVRGPRLQVADERGAGDSMTAGLVAGLAWGLPFPEALRLGTAAAVLNVARHGLGSGRSDPITQIAGHVELEAL